MSLKENLASNAKEYYKNGNMAHDSGEYNTSVTLFFKCISSLSDLYIFKKTGRFPTSHSDRFRILQKRFVDIYEILDKNFSYYQNSYRTKLNKEISEVFKDDCRTLFEINKIEN